MDKKVLIFFTIFAILMIGGSFVLSLWIFPNIVHNSRYMGFGDAGMIKPSPTHVLTREVIILIIAQMVTTFFIVWLIGKQLIKRINRDRPVTIGGYLYKISRITGENEYDIFCKAGEDWPVSSEQIDRDFRKYLAVQDIPYYVNDFVRKNKAHIDKFHLPLFQFQQH
jgi:hypothetical protein